MKIYLNFVNKAILISTIVLCGITANAQEEIKNAVNTKSYIFKAHTAIPIGEQTRQLSAGYELSVVNGTVNVFLPYFGRAFSQAIDPSEGGIKFTSTSFNYTVDEKKNSWNIVIKPNDTKDVRELVLTVFSNGNASLQVNSTRRQPISFNGNVQGYPSK